MHQGPPPIFVQTLSASSTTRVRIGWLRAGGRGELPIPFRGNQTNRVSVGWRINAAFGKARPATGLCRSTVSSRSRILQSVLLRNFLLSAPKPTSASVARSGDLFVTEHRSQWRTALFSATGKSASTAALSGELVNKPTRQARVRLVQLTQRMLNKRRKPHKR